MTDQLHDPQFERQIQSFLEWHAQDVAGAPTAGEIATRIGSRAGKRGVALPLSPQLIWVLVALLLTAAIVGTAIAGASLLRRDSGLTNLLEPSASPSVAPTAELATISGTVNALNAGNVAALSSIFSADAMVVLPHFRSDGREESAAYDLAVSTENALEVWMYPIDAWHLEAELRSCRVVTASTFRCDVTTRWHTLQVEIGEEWTFEFDAHQVSRLAQVRVAPNPTNRSLPLGYDDLQSWESWLRETHPEQAGRLLAGHELFWWFYFRYFHGDSVEIGASIQEYLQSR